jgi:hypothetical protein
MFGARGRTMDVEMKEMGDYLHARLRGPSSLEEGKKSLDMMLARVVELRKSKLLIDVTGITGEATLLERFALGEHIAAKNIEYYQKEGSDPLKLALLARASVINPGRLTQIVSRNRGVDFIVTDDMAEALEWLGVEDS